MARDEAAGDIEAPCAALARFRAFVSYSHADAAVARRLQRRLETYRIPRRLADRIAPIGAAAGRVGPVFRDREDLPASGDLSEAVKDALAQSQALIVLCSPEAAQSRWVAREIELFRALHPVRPVLAALMRGGPDEAFPAEITKGGAEPLAADFRRVGDGRRLAFLKVVAGILGIPLDELIQRDAQRRHRRVIAVTAAAIAAMLVLAAMTILAVQARREAEGQRVEAERQRGEAEGLVEYMLTDLRENLKGVGRLDLMTNVNRRAMKYYEDQGPLDRLSDDSLERRARIIARMGEDAENAGRLELAAARYEDALRSSIALLAKKPDDAARVFAQAQSENRLALLAYGQKNFAAAKPRFDKARQLLESISGWGRNQGEWLRFTAYANGNTCASMLKLTEDPKIALDHCRQAVAYNERLLALNPGDHSVSYDLVLHLLWLAEAQFAVGQAEAAHRTQARYLELSDSLVASDPDNMHWLEEQMEIYVRHAELLREQGEADRMGRFVRKATAIYKRLVERDPKNAHWSGYERRLSALSKE
ncbi:MAG: hypothetical protein QOJ27_1507 [Sphingomonadales bacterium]|nr:hypothetical protein [Sphingomonadales bacterium]